MDMNLLPISTEEREKLRRRWAGLLLGETALPGRWK